MSEKNIIGNAPCPGCRAKGRDKSGNHLMLFRDGGSYCNRCGYSEPPSTFTKPTETASLDAVGVQRKIDYVMENSAIAAVPHRKLKQHTCEQFGYRTEFSREDGTTPSCYPKLLILGLSWLTPPQGRCDQCATCVPC